MDCINLLLMGNDIHKTPDRVWQARHVRSVMILKTTVKDCRLFVPEMLFLVNPSTSLSVIKSDKRLPAVAGYTAAKTKGYRGIPIKWVFLFCCITTTISYYPVVLDGPELKR